MPGNPMKQVGEIIDCMNYLHGGKREIDPEESWEPEPPYEKYRMFHGDLKPVRIHNLFSGCILISVFRRIF